MAEQFLLTIFGNGYSATNVDRVRESFSGGVSKERVMERCSNFILPDVSRADRKALLALEDELRMDSTTSEGGIIDELARLAGVGEQVAAVTASAMRGEIDFKQSFTHRISL